jgi:ABC-type multidrug transport system fused ATPase/permease subunit
VQSIGGNGIFGDRESFDRNQFHRYQFYLVLSGCGNSLPEACACLCIGAAAIGGGADRAALESHADENDMADRFRKTLKISFDLYAYIWTESRSNQVWISVLTMILAPLMMVPLELQRRIVNEALQQKDLTLLTILGGVYFGIVCLQGAIKFGLNMLKGMVIEAIARDIRFRIVERVRNPDDGASTDLSPGTIVSMLAAETEDVSGFGGEAFGLPLLTGGTIVYVVGYLLWVQPSIAMLALALYLPQALIVPVTQYSINRLARLRIVNVRHLGHIAAGITDAAIAARVTGASIIHRIYALRIAIYLRKYALAALGNFLDSMGTIVVLAVGGYLVIRGETQVGTLLVFISGLNKIADPWDELINFYRSVSNTAVAYDMIRSQIESD